MATRERSVDRGRNRGRLAVQAIGREISLARRRLSLSLRHVANEVGISASELWRIEHGLAPWVSLVTLASLCSVVGLDMVARAYPGGPPLRDARHAALLSRLRSRVNAFVRWATEVPLPNPGDQRAWDALIRGDGWRYGVEAEMNPIDGQALLRRLSTKQRDGSVDGVILLLPDTRQTRLFRHEFADQLLTAFPVSTRNALRRMEAGRAPGGNAIVVL